jgi:hypothetical protein
MAYVSIKRATSKDAAPDVTTLELMAVFPLGKYHFITSPRENSVSVYREADPKASFGYSPPASGAGPHGETRPAGKAPSDVVLPRSAPGVPERYIGDPDAPADKGDERKFSGDTVQRAISRINARDGAGNPRQIDPAAVRQGLAAARRAGATADELVKINDANRRHWDKK